MPVSVPVSVCVCLRGAPRLLQTARSIRQHTAAYGSIRIFFLLLFLLQPRTSVFTIYYCIYYCVYYTEHQLGAANEADSQGLLYLGA